MKQFPIVIAIVALLAGGSTANAQITSPTADTLQGRDRHAAFRPTRSVVPLRLLSLSAAPQARAAGAYMNIGYDGLADFGWSSDPNVGSLQLGDHDPAVRGFTIPNVELTLDGAVDPYFKGFASIVYKLDAAGETGVELEEVYVLTTSLPHNLQIKGGAPAISRSQPGEEYV